MDLDLFLKSEFESALDFMFDMDLEKWSGTTNLITTAKALKISTNRRPQSKCFWANILPIDSY